MERRQMLRVTGYTAITGLSVLAGCSGPGPGDDADSNTSTTGDTDTVEMITDGGDYYFDPIGLFVESGETITFENVSGSHSATAYREGNGQASVTRIPEDGERFDSGVLTESGATFEHTFETAGTYDYYCIPHKSLGMVGRIVVDEPGGPAEGSVPPDGDVPGSDSIVEREVVTYESFGG